MRTAFVCVAKRTEFRTIKTLKLSIYIGDVTYSLSLILTYDEVGKGSTNEKNMKNMILPLTVSSVDIIVKIVLRELYDW